MHTIVAAGSGIRNFMAFETKLNDMSENLLRKEEEYKSTENHLQSGVVSEEDRVKKFKEIQTRRAEAAAKKQSIASKRKKVQAFNIPTKRQMLKSRAEIAMKKLGPYVMRLVRHQRTAEHLHKNLKISYENIQLLREIRTDIRAISVTLGGFTFQDMMEVMRYLDEIEASRSAVENFYGNRHAQSTRLAINE